MENPLCRFLSRRGGVYMTDSQKYVSSSLQPIFSNYEKSQLDAVVLFMTEKYPMLPDAHSLLQLCIDFVLANPEYVVAAAAAVTVHDLSSQESNVSIIEVPSDNDDSNLIGCADVTEVLYDRSSSSSSNLPTKDPDRVEVDTLESKSVNSKHNYNPRDEINTEKNIDDSDEWTDVDHDSDELPLSKSKSKLKKDVDNNDWGDYNSDDDLLTSTTDQWNDNEPRDGYKGNMPNLAVPRMRNMFHVQNHSDWTQNFSNNQSVRSLSSGELDQYKDDLPVLCSPRKKATSMSGSSVRVDDQETAQEQSRLNADVFIQGSEPHCAVPLKRSNMAESEPRPRQVTSSETKDTSAHSQFHIDDSKSAIQPGDRDKVNVMDYLSARSQQQNLSNVPSFRQFVTDSVKSAEQTRVKNNIKVRSADGSVTETSGTPLFSPSRLTFATTLQGLSNSKTDRKDEERDLLKHHSRFAKDLNKTLNDISGASTVVKPSKFKTSLTVPVIEKETEADARPVQGLKRTGLETDPGLMFPSTKPHWVTNPTQIGRKESTIGAHPVTVSVAEAHPTVIDVYDPDPVKFQAYKPPQAVHHLSYLSQLPPIPPAPLPMTCQVPPPSPPSVQPKTSSTVSQPPPPPAARSLDEHIEEMKDEVLQLIPDVEPTFLVRLLRVHYGPMAVNNVCSILLETPNYPKSTPVVAEEEKKEEVVDKVDYFKDYEQIHLSSDDYGNSLRVLQKDFKRISANDIRRAASCYRGHYAPTYKVLDDAMKEAYSSVSRSNDSSKSSHSKSGHQVMSITITVSNRGQPQSWTSGLLKCGRPAKGDVSLTEVTQKELEFVKRKEAERTEKEDFELAWRMNEEQYEEDGQTIECGCCFCEYPFESMVQCTEGHLFCSQCLNNYAKEAVFGSGKLDLTCMTSGCKASFSKSEMSRVLPSKIVTQYESRVQEESLNLADLENLVRCPHCNYAAIMDTNGDKVFRCQNRTCMKETCRLCKEDWSEHRGLPCEKVEKKDETKLRTKYEERMTEAKVRTCHRCKSKFTKEEGCNRMTCSCGATMCYICRMPKIDYNHFCRHPRDPGRLCKVCTACSLWTNPEEDDKRAIEEIRKEGQEKRKEQGYTEDRDIGAPEDHPVSKKRKR